MVFNMFYKALSSQIPGLLTSEATAAKAPNILKEVISRHIDVEILLCSKTPADENDAFLEVLSTRGIPNEHTLAVISALFLKLGKSSDTYMGSILLKLSNIMTTASGTTRDVKHLQDCVGSAVIAMGPAKLLAVLPISLDVDDQTCSNTWLIPILKDYVVGLSLGFFIETIVLKTRLEEIMTTMILMNDKVKRCSMISYLVEQKDL